MEEWRLVTWLLLGLNLGVLVLSVRAFILYKKKAAHLSRESYEKRPLLPEGSVEKVLPGDTLVIVIPECYENNDLYVKYIVRRVNELDARGVKLCVFQELMLKKSLIIVPRGQNWLADSFNSNIGGGSGTDC